MRKFKSKSQACGWLKEVMNESTKSYDNVRVALHKDTEDMVKYVKQVEDGKKLSRWRVDHDVIIGGDSATIGCDVFKMKYRFKGRWDHKSPL